MGGLLFPNLHTVRTLETDLTKISVPPYGTPSAAKYAFFAEAPSTQEMKQGQPLVGPAGGMLSRVLNQNKILRTDCYIANVCDTQLPANNTDKLYTEKGWTHELWPVLVDRMKGRINSLATDTVFLLGQTPLHALFPGYKVGKWRGSVLQHPDCPGKNFIPMYHPAFTLPGRAPEHLFTSIFDVAKGVRIRNEGLTIPAHELLIQPTFDDAFHWLTYIRDQCAVTTLDIELVINHISCLGLSMGRWSQVCCIPFFDSNGRYWSPDQELTIWQLIAQILESQTIKKMGQNGMFDLTALYHFLGIKTNNYWFDTMIGHHIAWADLPKGLDYLVSVYSDFPYYKEENKTWRKVDGNDYKQHWLYNCKDVAYTHYIAPKIMDEVLQVNGTRAFKKAMELHKPLLEMVTRGTRIDMGLRELMTTALEGDAEKLLIAIQALAEFPLNVQSPAQLEDFFYNKCGLPAYKNRKTGKPTCDKAALKSIKRNHEGTRVGQIADLILKQKKLGRLVSNYFKAPIQSDGRFRCEFKIPGTETGRLASGKSILGFGTNMQNITPIFKKVMKCDPLCFMGEGDLSQAESRVVAYQCEDPNMMRCYEEGLDAHTFNAGHIYGIPYEILAARVKAGDKEAKELRSMGKKIVHASNYSMGPNTMAAFIEKPVTVARQLSAAYHARFPNLKQWHREIREIVCRTRLLYNLFGRPKRFLGYLDDDLFRTAYAFIPQSTVGQCMTDALVDYSQDPWFYQTIKLITGEETAKTHALSTVHDSFLFQVATIGPLSFLDLVDYLSEVFTRIQSTFTQSLTTKGRTFLIPMDFKIGFSWGDMIEFKDPTPETLAPIVSSLLSSGVPAPNYPHALTGATSGKALSRLA